MQLSKASFRMREFWCKYFATATGGLVVMTGLFVMTKLSFWTFVQQNASAAMRELPAATSLNPFILLCVLVLFLTILALTGAPVFDFLVSGFLVPALDFCKDATRLLTGIWLSLLITCQVSCPQALPP